MNPDTFNAISPYLEDMAMILEEMLQEDTDNAKRLRYSLTEISKALGTEFSADLNVIVQAFSSTELRALPLVQVGLSSNNGDKPYSHSADCTPQRYIVGGEIQVVPRDRCPKCWEEWMNKFEYPICEHCEITLGKGCKVLLDSDLCPFCEAGHVSMQHPVCDDCGYEVDLTMRPARTAQRIDRFRCQEQTTAITDPRPTPSRTTLMGPLPGKDSKTSSAKSNIEISPSWSIPIEHEAPLQPKARFIHVIESCSTVAIETHMK